MLKRLFEFIVVSKPEEEIVGSGVGKTEDYNIWADVEVFLALIENSPGWEDCGELISRALLYCMGLLPACRIQCGGNAQSVGHIPRGDL